MKRGFFLFTILLIFPFVLKSQDWSYFSSDLSNYEPYDFTEVHEYFTNLSDEALTESIDDGELYPVHVYSYALSWISPAEREQFEVEIEKQLTRIAGSDYDLNYYNPKWPAPTPGTLYLYGLKGKYGQGTLDHDWPVLKLLLDQGFDPLSESVSMDFYLVFGGVKKYMKREPGSYTALDTWLSAESGSFESEDPKWEMLRKLASWGIGYNTLYEFQAEEYFNSSLLGIVASRTNQENSRYVMYEYDRQPYIESFKFMIKEGADMNQRVEGRSLSIFEMAGVELAAWMIENGLDIDQTCPVCDEETLLHRTAYQADYLEHMRAKAELLLDAGLDINSRDMHGETPLMWALEFKQHEMAVWLLEQGADPNLKDKEGNNTLSFASGKAKKNEKLMSYFE